MQLLSLLSLVCLRNHHLEDELGLRNSVSYCFGHLLLHPLEGSVLDFGLLLGAERPSKALAVLLFVFLLFFGFLLFFAFSGFAFFRFLSDLFGLLSFTFLGLSLLGCRVRLFLCLLLGFLCLGLLGGLV